MYLILVAFLMLFCSTISSYYWSQLDFIFETYTLYRRKQLSDLSLYALKNYGIAWFCENSIFLQETFSVNGGAYTIQLKNWPLVLENITLQQSELYTAELVYSQVLTDEHSCKLSCFLYSADQHRLVGQLVCGITYDPATGAYSITCF